MVDESKPHEPHPVCEMYPEYEDGIEGITYTIDGVANNFFDDVEFGYTTVYFADVVLGEGAGVHGGGMLSAQPGSGIIKENVAGSSHGGVRGRRNSRRRLAPTTGTSTLLVVYAVPPDAQNTDRTSAQMADELFGDYVAALIRSMPGVRSLHAPTAPSTTFRRAPMMQRDAAVLPSLTVS